MAEGKKEQDNNVFFALDIGTRSIIGVVGAVEGRRFHVQAIEKQDHGQRAMLDGQIENISQVAEVAGEVIARLEALGAEDAEPLSLAEELEAAILGNFASGSSAGRKKDPASELERLRAACPGAGLLPLAELEEFFRRFDAAFAAAAAKNNIEKQ